MSSEAFTGMLAGGHPNSLGRTIEVVNCTLADSTRLAELVDCYRSDDEVVRLRTSSALKRVSAEHPDWVAPFLNHLLDEVSQIDQASTQWTLAQLFGSLRPRMSADQVAKATAVIQRNLDCSDDWIVLIQSMQTLADWSADNQTLAEWLRPRLKARSTDPRTSVAARARKLLTLV